MRKFVAIVIEPDGTRIDYIINLPEGATDLDGIGYTRYVESRWRLGRHAFLRHEVKVMPQEPWVVAKHP